MIRIVEIVGVLVAAILLAALYVAKSGTASDSEKLAQLQAELARERGRISALDAEIAHQEEPENLRRLARAYLGFEPVRPEQELAFSELPRLSAQGAPEGLRAPQQGLPTARVSYANPGQN
ncbi:cell division protein FtsL [Oceanicaulis sp.]|uniref:cell division protein FtsL n=1 Tax=Oceanicaulis sp. TaxID=1924941 RepID=UPI003BA93E2A